MSATSIDPQRSKGQASKVQNGSLHQKDTVHDNDFEPYLTGQSNQNNSYQSMTDPYMSSYYAPSIGFPYPVSEAPWSTGGDPPIPYLTPYAPLSNGDHHFMHDTVFGQPGGLGSNIYPHRFNFFPENPAFSTWGTSGSQGQQTQSSPYGSSYSYPPSSLGGTLVDGQSGFHSDTLNKAPGMNSIEQGMLGLKMGADVSGSAVKAVGSVIGGALAANGGTAIGMPPPKPTSWAAVASKPAKPPLRATVKPGPPIPGGALPPPPIKHNMDIGTWDNKGPVTKVPQSHPQLPQAHPQLPQAHPQLAQSHPQLPQSHPQLPQSHLQLPQSHPQLPQSHPHLPQSHPQLPQSHPQLPQSHPQLPQSHPHLPQSHPQLPQSHPQLPQSHPHLPQSHPQLPQSHPQLPQSHPQLPPLQAPQSLLQQVALQPPPQPYQNHAPAPPPQTRWVAPRNRNPGYGGDAGTSPIGGSTGGPPGPGGTGPTADPHPVLEKLRAAHCYNPKEFDWNVKSGRAFIIKSYSEDDVHRSIKYSIWCSTEHGNKRLDGAFRAANGRGPVYLLFSVNGSGHFCGVAEMRSPVDHGASAGVWSQDKWKGKFDVSWLFVKDVPNSQLRHIRLENNDNKPVTNSRDTQEVPLEKAKQVLKIIASYKHATSIFDDFSHYEKRQEEEEVVRKNFDLAPIQNRSRLDQERQNRSKP